MAPMNTRVVKISQVDSDSLKREACGEETNVLDAAAPRAVEERISCKTFYAGRMWFLVFGGKFSINEVLYSSNAKAICYLAYIKGCD